MFIRLPLKLAHPTTIATLLLLVPACSDRPSSRSVAPTPAVVAVTQPTPVASASATSTAVADGNFLATAEDKATSAASLAQSASSPEDWDLITSKLEQAIAVVKAIPPARPERAIAQKKLIAYQRQLRAAKQKRGISAKSEPLPIQPRAVNSTPSTTVASRSLTTGSLTTDNYNRVEFGMSPDQVRSILGKPDSTQGNEPHFSWTWKSTDKQTTITIAFYKNKVAGRSCVSSSSTIDCVSKT